MAKAVEVDGAIEAKVELTTGADAGATAAGACWL
jgi:hypothetical protein